MYLTVIVTVYNIAEYLPRFFESMMKQSFTDFTLLMIDDGSEDDSLIVCKQFSELDSRIQVLSLEHVGIAKARNIAMEHIHTEFAAYADGDDYVECDYLKHLVDAQKKYDADLVISRVQYLLEDGTVEGCFRERGELALADEEILHSLAMLLDDRRLNYLYGKIFRSSILKTCNVEDDVRQGSDTMINFEYVVNIKSVVLIDDLDYHYIRYSNRSVTSYRGKDAFDRLLRINVFIFKLAENQGFLTNDLINAIDDRILQSATWIIKKILNSDLSEDEKAEQIDHILTDNYYILSYKRYVDRNESLEFDVAIPQKGKKYLQRYNSEIKRLKRKESILEKTPAFMKSIYYILRDTWR